MLENFSDAMTSPGRAFQIHLGVDLLSNLLTFLGGDRPLAAWPRIIGGGSNSQIGLAADQDDGKTSAKVLDFGDPLLLNIVQGVAGINGEADQDDVGVRVREGAETVVIFLASRIPQGELHRLAIDIDLGNVILENSGHIDLWECTLGEDNQQTGFATGTVTDNDQLASDFSHFK